MLGFKSFWSAAFALVGIEITHMIHEAERFPIALFIQPTSKTMRRHENSFENFATESIAVTLMVAAIGGFTFLHSFFRQVLSDQANLIRSCAELRRFSIDP